MSDTKDTESIYGDAKDRLNEELERLMHEIEIIRAELFREIGMDPIEHLLGRIKAEESMRSKCDRRGLPRTARSALVDIHDAIGIRVVCAFIDDVYKIRDRILALPDIEMFEEKDYIRHVKPNGYRSYHLIVKTGAGFFAEIQLRTISMDTWAALEHQLRYKKDVKNVALIQSELKRCADEIASTDLSMQTVREMIEGEL